MIKTFALDKMLRDSSGKPIARVILAKDYVPGEEIYVFSLEHPRQFFESAKGKSVYVDGEEYKVQDEIHPVKVSTGKIRGVVNNIILSPVKKG